jgi:hypothetical protein
VNGLCRNAIYSFARDPLQKKQHTAGSSKGIGPEISPKPRIFYLNSLEEHALIEITIVAGMEKSTFFLFF